MQVSESRYFPTWLISNFSRDCNVRHILLYFSKFIKLIVFSFWMVYSIVFTIRCTFSPFVRSFALRWQACVVSCQFRSSFSSIQLPKILSVVNWLLRRYQRCCIHKVEQVQLYAYVTAVSAACNFLMKHLRNSCCFNLDVTHKTHWQSLNKYLLNFCWILYFNLH